MSPVSGGTTYAAAFAVNRLQCGRTRGSAPTDALMVLMGLVFVISSLLCVLSVSVVKSLPFFIAADVCDLFTIPNISSFNLPSKKETNMLF
jgi:hypothetical protein